MIKRQFVCWRLARRNRKGELILSIDYPKSYQTRKAAMDVIRACKSGVKYRTLKFTSQIFTEPVQ